MTNSNKITSKQAERLLKMSYLKVDESLIEKTSQTVANIVSWAEQLNEVNTEKVKPMFALADLLNQQMQKLREDNITDGGYVASLLQNAPDKLDVFFAVPKVIDEEK